MTARNEMSTARSEIDRIFKGYRPKSDKLIYALLYDFLAIVATIKLKFLEIMRR